MEQIISSLYEKSSANSENEPINEIVNRDNYLDSNYSMAANKNKNVTIGYSETDIKNSANSLLNGNLGQQISFSPNWSNNDYSDLYISSASGRLNSEDSQKKTIELKLIDGTMVVETFSFRDIKSIREKEKNGKKYTNVVFKRYFDDEVMELDVDCKITAFMRLIGTEYIPWHKTMMEMSVKDGEEV